MGTIKVDHVRRPARTFLVLAFLLMNLSGIQVIGATPEQVEIAVRKAIDSLYSRQKDGIWETLAAAPTEGKRDRPEEGQWGGVTAVDVFALLAAGEKSSDPRLLTAINFLLDAKMHGVYAVGMRTQIYPLLPKTKAVTDAARRDAKLLMDSVKTGKDNPLALGMWSYYVDKADDSQGDHSASQIALLGLWACEEVGVELPQKVWQLEDTVWRQHQLPEGAWPYVYKSEKYDWHNPFLSMTCAGLSSLFITQDKLKRGQTSCDGNAKDSVMSNGMDAVARMIPKDGDFSNVPASKGPARPYYLLFGMQRLGVYSGYRYFGNVDWFQSGADFLVKTQNADGGWGDTTYETALALLFFSRGRAPVAINKLNYSADKDDSPPWNQRPRDAANFVRWMGKQMERPFNWQIVDLASDPNAWMDSPVLYLSGSDDLHLKPEQQVKLRAYVEAGGMIAGNADCGNSKFATGFKKLGTSLFPTEEFRELPADHVMFTNQLFPRKKWKSKLSIQGLSNGARELLVLFPDADPSKAWQLQNSVSRSEAFEAMSDVYLYNAGPGAGKNKGYTRLVKPDPKINATRTIKVARLQYAGNWDPEPGGWRRLAAIARNQQQIDLDLQPVELGKKQLSNSFAVAHLTGSHEFKLTAAGKEELKSFIDGGGVLIVDAVGGSGAFVTSAETELEQLVAGAQLKPIENESAIYQKPIDLQKIDYRPFARRINGASTTARLKGIEHAGRLAVIFSPLDLSVGLTGSGVDGINGYDPASATNLMINLICSSKRN